MRTNRKRRSNGNTTHSYVLVPTICIILALTLGFGANLFINSKCAELGKSIRKLETEIVSLRKSYTIQQNAWAETTKPENLEIALGKHGIYMEGNLKDKQIVSLNAPVQDGKFQRNTTSYAKNTK